MPRVDELAIRAEGAEVRRASGWLQASCERHGVPQPVADRLELCLNEALANIIDHGGSGALAAPITLTLEIAADATGGAAGVTVCDAGAAFDPLSVPAGPAPKTLEEASLGGLGLVMIRRCSDWVDYRRDAGWNRLTFGARWSPR